MSLVRASPAVLCNANLAQSESTARQYEELLALQRRVQAQISMIDPETRREVDDIQALENDITRYRSSEYAEPAASPNGQTLPSSSTSNANFKRYSLSTMPSTSNAFGAGRKSHTGSQVTSPFNEPRAANNAMAQVLKGHLPPPSVPTSNSHPELEANDNELAAYRPKAGAK